MATVHVLPGVCGFETRIVATADEMLQARVEIESQCVHIKQMAEQLQELSAMDELMRPINETSPYLAAAQCRAHAACPVPSAILKALEVATGMALPADVQIRISRE